jgi:hypothetical protein
MIPITPVLIITEEKAEEKKKLTSISGIVTGDARAAKSCNATRPIQPRGSI